MDVPETCEFIVGKEDQAQLQTRTNGDTLIFSNIRLSRENATILAWLVNSPKQLKVEVKSIDADLEE